MNFLEIRFSLRGKTLLADHGYALYSALKKTVLEGKDFPADVLLYSVPGIPDRHGMVYLDRRSKLRLRCPAEQVQEWYRKLQNSVLDIQGHLIRLVRPQIALLEPSQVLKARLVTIKLEAIDHSEMPFHFLESCQKALARLEIEASVAIDSNGDGDLARRALKVKDKQVVGFGVVVENLKAEDSIALQRCGLGGRKHFGCGWFYPVKEGV
ncbi:type I-MYXAN CRISPR-associated protein Cas6/Cmx6 [Synechococcus sp. PCC 7336]|uniref:type I-MYXAN CRISPR-associated protein Cas6/Cmx6 n=1 Tax=Synechococcus sp. PCC 7336 TaxID=195250 RepID=UPI00034A8DB0|nr:type I-MYXAN CRISPR-associated protein Cas6/Cmx6 [Synechococcus sp. PCC 7336]